MNLGRSLVLGLYRTQITDELLSFAHEVGVQHLDTAYNYGGFLGLDHLALYEAPAAFKITSKVGFFPSAGHSAEHSLEPARLLCAIEDTVARLRAPLDVILLHNPERAAHCSGPEDLPRRIASAVETLKDAVTSGLASRWGFSIWEPQALLAHLAPLELQPDVLMTRVGLTVGPQDLAAIEACREALAWPGLECRGMAPLGGRRVTRLLSASDLRSFVPLATTNAQAAVRVSFELPRVSLVALGTSFPAHLNEAVEACAMAIDDDYTAAYRTLLRDLGHAESLAPNYYR